MTEPQHITPDHVRSLLEARDDAVLGLVDGDVRVLDADPGADRGILEVLTRADLVERLGPDPDDDAVRAEAEALTAAAQGLGG